MTDKLLKIVFIEKSDTTELKSLNNVYGEITTCYKFVKDEKEVEELISALVSEEKLSCKYIDDVLYVEGLKAKMDKAFADKLHSLAEELKSMKCETIDDFIEKMENDPPKDIPDTEKDIIDKLAEKYRKEAEDKGKLN